MKNLGPEKMVEELKRLNGKKSQFDLQTYSSPIIIFGTIATESLLTPDGYYVNKQGRITNKKNVAPGEPVETFAYECNVPYFQQKAIEHEKAERKKNNPLFKPLFGSKGKKDK